MSKALGVILVNIGTDTMVRTTLFVVIPFKASYNLLLGREWIHDVRAVSSTMHKKLLIWRPDGILENFEVGQNYFLAKVDKVNKRTFDKKLETISPFIFVGMKFSMQEDIFYSIKLYPTYGFFVK